MHTTQIKSWSTLMKIALLVLSALGALVCLLSVITLFTEEKAESAVLYRAIGGAVLAALMLYIKSHPEWQRSFEEKF